MSRLDTGYSGWKGYILKQETQVKYLGVTFSYNLKWGPHIQGVKLTRSWGSSEGIYEEPPSSPSKRLTSHLSAQAWNTPRSYGTPIKSEILTTLSTSNAEPPDGGKGSTQGNQEQ